MLQKRIDGYMPRGYWAIHKISQEKPRIIETVTKKFVVKDNLANDY